MSGFLGGGAPSAAGVLAALLGQTVTANKFISALPSVGTNTTNAANTYYGIAARNPTAATLGVSQNSPQFVLGGRAVDTATETDQPVDFLYQVTPTDGTSAPTGSLVLRKSINNATPVTLFTWGSDGSIISSAPALGTAVTATHTFQNTTAAAAGAQQYSPALSLIGRGWKTDATAASQSVAMLFQVQPVQGTSAPFPSLVISKSIASAAPSAMLTVKDDGFGGLSTLSATAWTVDAGANQLKMSAGNSGVQMTFGFNSITIAESQNFLFGTTTGSQLGSATNQKWAAHGATPVIQRASSAQAAVVATGATLAAYGYTQAQADAIVTLVNELRAAMVEKGLIKGSA